MIKDFGQWLVVKDGIKTAVGYEYRWISREDITNGKTLYAKELCKSTSIDKKSLCSAFKYAYRYFHAMTIYTSESHPEIHKEMMFEYADVEWNKLPTGNYTIRMPQGINITVYKNTKDRWTWVYDDIYSNRTYKNLETAKKKAFASYYWLFKHIKKGN